MKRTGSLLGHRRSFLYAMLGAAGGSAAMYSLLSDASGQPNEDLEQGRKRAEALVGSGEKLTITKLETFLVKPRWLFLKVHTDAGSGGLGEPITEGRARTCAAAVKQIEP